MDTAMNCKKGTMKHFPFQETEAKSCESNCSPKTKACIKNQNSYIYNTTSESSLQQNHKDHIAGKGCNAITHKSVIYKFIPVPQAMKILDAKAPVDKEWKEPKTILAWQLEKV